jgi:hypothetical protein
MQGKTVWQQGSNEPDNATHFATISQWWTELDGKEVTWRQRLIPPSGDVGELDWEPQRFDEIFVIRSPQVRGITLYWQKPDAKEERNTTVHKLELDHFKQQLYIYPQSQLGLVIRVGLPQVVYQQIKLENPQWTVTTSSDQSVLMLRDDAQKLEIQIMLSPNQVSALKQQLGSS